MTNLEPLKILKKNLEDGNKWQAKNLDLKIDLRRANLKGANLSETNLLAAQVLNAKLTKTNLTGACIQEIRGSGIKVD